MVLQWPSVRIFLKSRPAQQTAFRLFMANRTEMNAQYRSSTLSVRTVFTVMTGHLPHRCTQLLIITGITCISKPMTLNAITISKERFVESTRIIVMKDLGSIHTKDARFFWWGNSAADISKSHTFKWDPLADEVLEAAWSSPTEKRRPYGVLSVS